MRAELKSLFSLSHPHLDLESWSARGEPFGLNLTLFIGVEGDHKSDGFDLTLCTSDWFDAQTVYTEDRSLMRILIVEEFNYASLRAELSHKCKKHSADSWEALAMQIDAWALWEFRSMVLRHVGSEI